MVDAELAAVKIALIRPAVDRIEATPPDTLDAFLDDADRRNLVTLNLFVAIQECIALATHVVADAGWSVPQSYGDTSGLLAENEIIDSELGQRLRRATGLRNLIAHQYGELDYTRLCGFARNRRGDLDLFCQRIADLAIAP